VPSVLARYVIGAEKDAPTFIAEIINTVHVGAVPEHAPVHPWNNVPLPGVSVSTTLVLVTKLATHITGHVIPAGILTTEPLPLVVTVSVSVPIAGITLMHIAGDTNIVRGVLDPYTPGSTPVGHAAPLADAVAVIVSTDVIVPFVGGVTTLGENEKLIPRYDPVVPSVTALWKPPWLCTVIVVVTALPPACIVSGLGDAVRVKPGADIIPVGGVTLAFPVIAVCACRQDVVGIISIKSAINIFFIRWLLHH
jgi:hypothetical protein